MGHEVALAESRDNASSAATAKVQIRRLVLEAIGPGRAAVFDAFAGAGKMHANIWREAADYVGCDLKAYWPADRLAFAAPNERVMRAIDLSNYNIFDIDAYGCPWAQATIIAARRRVSPGELVGLTITEGNALAMQMCSLSAALAALTGLRRTVLGSHRRQDQIVDAALQEVARRMNAKVIRQWRTVGRRGSKMQYLGVILEGLPASPVGPPEAPGDISSGVEPPEPGGPVGASSGVSEGVPHD
jgi:hypothetical protein